MYKNNPTAGGLDGTQVSEGTELEPVSVGPLNASLNEESSPIKLAIRCSAGYRTYGNTIISIVGDSNIKWALAPDSGGSAGTWREYGAALIISNTIVANNYIIWAKAKATSEEVPANDTSVDFHITTIIEAI